MARTRLARELSALGVRSGAVVLVHCSMSSLGSVLGGAETVVEALVDAVGPRGTVVAYTGWADGPPEDLSALAPTDRALVHAEHPAYDPRVARARRDHGRVAEALRTWPGAVHSGHPEAGVAAVGAAAEEVAHPHPLDDAYGAGTPYARVVEFGGQVVLLGEPLGTVTLVHHAEAIARVSGKRRVTWDVPIVAGGERTWTTLHDIDTAAGALDYTKLVGGGDHVAWLARDALDAGAGSSGPLGATTGHVFEARALVERVVMQIERAFADGRQPDDGG